MIMKCRLCLEDKPLKQSHIIPKMFYRAIKNKSHTRILREVKNPNKSLQDGLKLQFLCESCEELFSKYETSFSNNIYSKTIKNGGNIQFQSRDDNLVYFLLSIAWRVLKHTREKDSLESLTNNEKTEVDNVLEHWRKILYTQNKKEIFKVQQFIIPTNKLSFFQDMPQRIYNNCGSDFKTFDKEDTFEYAFTFVQVPYFIFVASVWGQSKTMKQYCINSTIKSRQSTLPKHITTTLEKHQYESFEKADRNLSEKQREIILDRAIKSIYN